MAKVTEKALFKQITVSVVIVVVSMLCLSISSWAMFSDKITYAKQTLVAANFSVDVEITANGSTVSPTANNTYLLETGTYTVTATAKGTANATSGYAVMEFDDKRLFTPQLLPARQGEVAAATKQTVPAAVTFTLEITGAAKVVTFERVWGTSTAAIQGLDTLIGDTVLIDTPVIEKPEQSKEPEESTDTQSTVSQEESEAASQVSEDTASASDEQTSSPEVSATESTTQE